MRIEDAEVEIKRVGDAIELAKAQLQKLYDKALKEVGEANAAIFEVHQMMLEDEDYLDAIHNMISTEKVNAEYAVAVTGDNFSEMFSGMDDDYMKARAADIKDISNRLGRNLAGAEETDLGAMEPSIIVADDLSPSETVQMDKEKILAFVTVHGSVKENIFIHTVFCGDCGGSLSLHRKARKAAGGVKVCYDYICPNSESYGEKFCKRKRIKMQELEEAVGAALRLHINLFLDTKAVMENLNRTAQAKQIQDGYRRQMAETRNRMERAQSMNSSLYSDYADGLLNERDYLYAKKKYVKEAEELAQKLSELAAVQATYEAEYAGGGGMAETIGRYADFQELSSEIVHALVRRIVFFGEGRVEIEYTFADEMKEFVELAECRKGEVLCTKEETV